MGYPMTYARVVGRNGLNGPGYDHPCPMTGETATSLRSLVSGDMRRLEQDQRDEHHLKLYAEHADITVEQAKAVLDLFFKEGYNGGQPFNRP